MKKVICYLAALAASACFFSCLDSAEGLLGEGSRWGSEDGYFDFATTRNYTLTVDYDLPGYRAGVLFEVWDQNPGERCPAGEDASAYTRRKEGLEPVFRAVTTPGGHFRGPMKIASGIRTIWITCDYPGVRRMAEVAIGDRCSITFDTAADGAPDRTEQGVRRSWPAELYPVCGQGDWDVLGVPSYLNPAGRREVPFGLLEDIRKALPEGAHIASGPLARLASAGCCHDICFCEDTEVELAFLHGSALRTNTIGYYTYPAATPPDDPQALARRIIAFPNASHLGQGGGLLPGDCVKLRYWDGDAWYDKFPAGTAIGFFVLPDAFDHHTGNIRPGGCVRYCSPSLGGDSPAVTLYNGERGLAVLAFDELGDGAPRGDGDYNDLLFCVSTSSATAMDIPGERAGDLAPDADPGPKEYSIRYAGTLAFEDLWPNRGDYDMNDVGVEYTCVVWRDKDNLVTRVEDKFRPVHKGAEYANGFGYQYGVPVSAVRGAIQWSVTPEKAKPWYLLNDKGLEANQGLATVMLFDDIRAEIEGPAFDYEGDLQTPKYEYAVVTEFCPAQPIEAVGFPPYNPFIVVIHTDGDNYVDPRNREVHLPNHAPTDLARGKDNGQWFGHYADKSNKSGLWYVAAENYPFAINIPAVNFRFPPEKTPIDHLYPEFSAWARSRGMQSQQWYK